MKSSIKPSWIRKNFDLVEYVFYDPKRDQLKIVETIKTEKEKVKQIFKEALGLILIGEL
jgi:hypothetical protein